MAIAREVMETLNKYDDPKTADILSRFFKTGKGQYGEGDIFIGLKVPLIRKLAKQFCDLQILELEKLLESPIHEHRFAALVIMVEQFKRRVRRKELYNLYLNRTDRINNWDLVDVSCRDIVGGYLADKPRTPLYKLADSDNLWERRIAIVSTWFFIRLRQFDDTLAISAKLIDDDQDLIQKAVGWMLREVGKKNKQTLTEFLDLNASKLARTTLRYSIERLNKSEKLYYMSRTKSYKNY